MRLHYHFFANIDDNISDEINIGRVSCWSSYYSVILHAQLSQKGVSASICCANALRVVEVFANSRPRGRGSQGFSWTWQCYEWFHLQFQIGGHPALGFKLEYREVVSMELVLLRRIKAVFRIQSSIGRVGSRGGGRGRWQGLDKLQNFVTYAIWKLHKSTIISDPEKLLWNFSRNWPSIHFIIMWFLAFIYYVLRCLLINVLSFRIKRRVV